jgi:hypothetical protein
MIFLASTGAAPLVAQFSAPRTGTIALRATYGERGAEIARDLLWRIYSVRGTDARLVVQSAEPRPSFALPVGEYALHVTHGLASAVRTVNVAEGGAVVYAPIHAGELVVFGHLGAPEIPIPPERQRLSVFIPSANNSEARLVTNALRQGEALHLPEGTYHLVSTFAGSNSVIRSDVKIETGKTKQAIVNHRAARMTMKLVRVSGGVAIAGAQWTVITPGGDIVAEAAGAFPSVDIAEGAYTVIAQHDEREYRGVMTVDGGHHRDFEIVIGD